MKTVTAREYTLPLGKRYCRLIAFRILTSDLMCCEQAARRQHKEKSYGFQRPIRPNAFNHHADSLRTWSQVPYQGFALRWMNGWAFGPDGLWN
jgi:hypothetical protein